MSGPIDLDATGYLTDDEKRAVDLMGDFTEVLASIIRGASRTDHEGEIGAHDMAEAVVHIHALQNMVLAQAAARAYPGTYRLMGQSLSTTEEELHDDED